MSSVVQRKNVAKGNETAAAPGAVAGENSEKSSWV